MEDLNFSRLREVNVKWCEDVFHKLDEWTPIEWALAMIGEAGEACNEVKKINHGDGCAGDLAMELADLVIYADLLAARLHIDLGQAVVHKFNLVSDKRGSSIKL
ncbi:MAG: MazG-like family protein [Gammaproteobacteria bacterium]|nr:MazG-like family protein [Gammaproteobacteria bacterium]